MKTSKGICPNCKEIQNTILIERDLKATGMHEGKILKDIPVYVCSKCYSLVAVPASATKKITKQL